MAFTDVQERWIKPTLENRTTAGVLVASSGVYNAAMAPAAVGDMVFGFVLVGAKIDHAFVGLLSDAAKSEVVLVADQLLGSTLPAPKLPWRTSKEWKSALSQSPGQQVFSLEGENYLAQSLRLGPEGEGAALALDIGIVSGEVVLGSIGS